MGDDLDVDALLEAPYMPKEKEVSRFISGFSMGLWFPWLLLSLWVITDHPRTSFASCRCCPSGSSPRVEVSSPSTFYYRLID